ncbi:hypothetical protein ACLB2K_076057 [Fragaria x ananassa]
MPLYKCNHPPYGKDLPGQVPTGRYSNGKIGVDFMASNLGLKEDLLPSYLDPKLTDHDLLTGVSFASGGCGLDDLTLQLTQVYSMQDQLEYFDEAVERIKTSVGEKNGSEIVENALFVVGVGTNDLILNVYDFPLTQRKSQFTSTDQYFDFLLQKLGSFIQVDRVSEFAKGQEEKLVKFVSVAEKLAQELSAPNENLESFIAGLKKEVDSTIAEKSVERQKRPRNESSAEDEMMRPMGVQLVQELDCKGRQSPIASPMGDFNLELLQKFRKFKTEKFSEQDRIREDQENKFKNYISVSEEVSEYLHSSIWELKTQVKDLKKELVSLRHAILFWAMKDDQSKVYQKRLLEEEQKVEVAAKDEEIMECRKLLMEEKQKNKELSDENERLKQLQEKLISSRLKNTKDAQLCITTTGGHVSRETTKHTKRSGGRKINIPRA